MSTENIKIIRLILLVSVILVSTMAGPSVQIGNSTVVLSLVDISWIAIGQTSFATAFSRIVDLANFSLIDRLLDVIALTVLLLCCWTLLARWWLDERKSIQVSQPAPQKAGMSAISQMILVGSAALAGGAVVHAKAGFDYGELYEKAGLIQKAPIDERFQFGPPKLGEKSGF